MLRFFGLPALLVAGLVIVLPGDSRAAVMSLEGGTYALSLGNFGTAIYAQSPGSVSVSVSSGTGSFDLPAGLFAGTAIIPTQIFTGLSIVSSLNVVASNQPISVSGGAGAGAITALGIFGVCGGIINLNIPFDLGGGGGTAAAAAALQISVTLGAGWTTGAATVTGVTGTTAGGGIANTVSLSGFDDRTAGHAGTILLVTPARILSSVNGFLPVFGRLHLTFVPEPGLLLLLGAAAGGVFVLGRSRR